MTVPLGSLWDIARRIAGNGADVVVDEPPDLRDAVVRLLTGSAKAARPNATSTGERLAAEDDGLLLRETVGESG